MKFGLDSVSLYAVTISVNVDSFKKEKERGIEREDRESCFFMQFWAIIITYFYILSMSDFLYEKAFFTFQYWYVNEVPFVPGGHARHPSGSAPGPACPETLIQDPWEYWDWRNQRWIQDYTAQVYCV